MKVVELTWPRVIKIWWSLVWKALLIGFLVAVILKFAVGFVGTAIGMDEDSIRLIAQAIVIIATNIVWIFVLRWVLKDQYSDFRIAMVTDDESPEHGH
jgi:hypothetical protein